jgi:FtsP/CotA-like multicopper oxidase with cupredoxin domain
MLGGSVRRFVVSVAMVASVVAPGSVSTSSIAATFGDQTVASPRIDAPTAATITIANGSRAFTPANVTLAKGGTLTVYNRDSDRHSVTSDDKDSTGSPLFSVIVNPGAPPTKVPGVENLAPGTYDFHCVFHAMRGTLTISGSGGGVQPAAQSFDQPLVKPKVLTTATVKIPIKQADVRVLPTGPLTRMWTYGGTYPGPTIKRPAGKDTKVTYVNKLPTKASLTVHLHGDHHKWTNDGQPTHFLIPQGKSRTYDYPLKDNGHPERASFFWYHDHRMNATTHDNVRGLQGMFIVTDGQAKKLGLPSGGYDLPLMVSERSFTSDNQLVDAPKRTSMLMTGPTAPPNDGTVGDHILVNGRYAPYLNVATHRYRLRLLNSSPFTTYDFALSDGRPFVQIGTGNGLLPKSVVRQDILLGPAQRADVIVDFRGELNSDVVLESIPRVNPPKNAAGTPSAQIMQFRVRSSVSDSSKVPSSLQAAPKMTIPSKVSAVWSIGLTKTSNGSAWNIDGKVFNPKRVVLKVPRGATQLWELRNPTNVTHFFHLHEEQWRTVQRDGKTPPAWERGLEDTWRLDPGETVRVVGKFTDFTGVFMVHCHMLDHEDDGLMSQFAVVDPRTKALPKGYTYDASGGPAARARAVAATRTASATPVTSVLVSDPTGWMCEPVRSRGARSSPAAGARVL